MRAVICDGFDELTTDMHSGCKQKKQWRAGRRKTARSDRLRPLDLQLAMVSKAVAQVQVDESLVWNASLFGHALEVLNNVLGEPHGDRLLQL